MSARALLSALALCLCAAPVLADRLTVAVASNFLTTARDIAAIFSAETGHEVTLAHGSTGKLYAQIVAGAPFDLFLSADTERPARLAAAGLVAEDGLRPYALGRLALVHDAGVAPGTLDAILAREDLRVAIADPEIAPYGIAARSVLQEFRGPDWKRDLVLGESVGQAFAFVATGNAEAGLVALSQVVTHDGEIWSLTVPEELHDPIRQDAVLLARAAHRPAARAFLAFLGGDMAREILTEAGYEVP